MVLLSPGFSVATAFLFAPLYWVELFIGLIFHLLEVPRPKSCIKWLSVNLEGCSWRTEDPNTFKR